MREFKIGDKVCSLSGDGIITRINNEGNYPIVVDHGSVVETYTLDGLDLVSDIFPTLFHVDEKPEQWKIKRKVELVKWVNVYPNDRTTSYRTEHEAIDGFDPTDVIAIAVKMVGSYEVVE